ncbi:MAG: CoA-acylating methylmalonate-semialdehyde dehydrogenase [Betaproteobacteria bacterium]|nr:CoA-acylating methylmalonate-semialdehyde dehydrogenase [Betaproteobacteria bacterium]
MADLNIRGAARNCRNLSAGDWHDDAHLPRRDVVSPHNGKVIGQVPLSGVQEVARTVEAAALAWPRWAQTPIRTRAEILARFKSLMQQNLSLLADSVSAESGKTRVEAEAGLQKGMEIIDFAVSSPNLDLWDSAEVSIGVQCQFRRESLGVVAGITPFNFPAMVPLWMIPLALIVGNAFILKPSEKVPLTSQLLAQLLMESGLPRGVFSIVNGGAEVVDALLVHPEVKAIGFVGSTAVASHVYRTGTAHHKRVLALGGAKNHIIVTPDCDPNLTAKGILSSFTGCAGQRCMAASVLLAVGDVDHVIQKVVELAKGQCLGRDMGAIIDDAALKRIERAITQAESEGAKILLDGRGQKASLAESERGFWVGPTIIDHARPEMECAQMEIFGPVLTIIRASRLDEAVGISNASPYGNAAAVFTTRGDVAHYVASNANAGMIGINIGVPVPREPFSFGGTKQSRFGHGDITGRSGLDFWSDFKKITTTWPALQSNSSVQVGQFLLHTT